MSSNFAEWLDIRWKRGKEEVETEYCARQDLRIL